MAAPHRPLQHSTYLTARTGSPSRSLERRLDEGSGYAMAGKRLLGGRAEGVRKREREGGRERESTMTLCAAERHAALSLGALSRPRACIKYNRPRTDTFHCASENNSISRTLGLRRLETVAREVRRLATLAFVINASRANEPKLRVALTLCHACI